jgi:hypothetical protein
MSTPNDPTMSHDSLDSVIAAYMMAVEAGEVPNRHALLDQYPEHADGLLAFFAALDRMDRVASPLRIADGLEATGAGDSNRHADLPTIRYFGDYELLEEIARGGMEGNSAAKHALGEPRNEVGSLPQDSKSLSTATRLPLRAQRWPTHWRVCALGLIRERAIKSALAWSSCSPEHYSRRKTGTTAISWRGELFRLQESPTSPGSLLP